MYNSAENNTENFISKTILKIVFQPISYLRGDKQSVKPLD